MKTDPEVSVNSALLDMLFHPTELGLLGQMGTDSLFVSRYIIFGGSRVKESPAVHKIQEMWVQSLAQKDALEKNMATHSSILAWEIPWTEEPGGLQSMGLQRVRHD